MADSIFLSLVDHALIGFFSHLPEHIWLCILLILCRTARKILEFTGSSSVRGSCRPLDASASSLSTFGVLYNANLPQVVVS